MKNSDSGNTAFWQSGQESMGTHPLISQLANGGTISRAQARAIEQGGYDSELASYGYSPEQVHNAKLSFGGQIASGIIKLV